MMNNKVTKVELKKVFKRSFMYGSSWNYERMQNLGFLYTILPVLKKLYPDKDSASPAMKRHLEFSILIKQRHHLFLELLPLWKNKKEMKVQLQLLVLKLA